MDWFWNSRPQNRAAARLQGLISHFGDPAPRPLHRFKAQITYVAGEEDHALNLAGSKSG